MYKYLLSSVVMVLVGVLPAEGQAADTERGKMLYENHCTSCHESVLHIREDRRAKALGEIYWQTTRWSVTQQLEWRYDDVRDVAQYLNNQFYKFNERMECK
jgi:mono/diheme cytochrome c family protein